MESQIKLVRSIGSEFVTRKLKSVALVIGIVLLIILAAAIWLTTFSPWWWLIAAPVIIFSIFAMVLYIFARMVVKRLRPNLTKPQALSVKNFVDKLERVADNLQTPMPLIVFHMLRDIARPRKKAFIHTLTEDSTTLRKDFLELQKNFS